MPAPLVPPLHYPVRDLSRSPNHEDALYWELISRDSAEYNDNTPIKRGTPYSTIKGAKQSVIDIYTNGLWFCEEIVPLRSSEVGGMPGHQFVIWLWSTDRMAQSQTNANISYSADNISYPIFMREKIVRRDAYETDPTDTAGSALTALIGVTITEAGAGYTTATGTIGTATVEFVCSLEGELIAGIVTSEGSGITSGGSITITGDGDGAVATAVIQPATAVLVHQEKRELPQDSNLSHEFVQVILVYQTLPGPERVSYEQGPEGKLIKIVRQTVAGTTKPTATGANLLSDVVTVNENVNVGERETRYAVAADGTTAAVFEVITETAVDKPICTIYTSRKWPVEAATDLADVDSVFATTGFVIAARKIPINDSPNYVHEVDYMLAKPATYTEAICAPFSFPGEFEITLSGVGSPILNDTEANYLFKRPIPGIDYKYKTPRRGRFPMLVTYTFHRLAEGALPTMSQTFNVITPGTASRRFNIPDNTVHDAIDWWETGANGAANRQCELIVASTPTRVAYAAYASTVQLVVSDDLELWKGKVYVRRLVTVKKGYGDSVQTV